MSSGAETGCLPLGVWCVIAAAEANTVLVNTEWAGAARSEVLARATPALLAPASAAAAPRAAIIRTFVERRSTGCMRGTPRREGIWRTRARHSLAPTATRRAR